MWVVVSMLLMWVGLMMTHAMASGVGRRQRISVALALMRHWLYTARAWHCSMKVDIVDSLTNYTGSRTNTNVKVMKGNFLK
jgi:hypothetical protein